MADHVIIFLSTKSSKNRAARSNPEGQRETQQAERGAHCTEQFGLGLAQF